MTIKPVLHKMKGGKKKGTRQDRELVRKEPAGRRPQKGKRGCRNKQKTGTGVISQGKGGDKKKITRCQTHLIWHTSRGRVRSILQGTFGTIM